MIRIAICIAVMATGSANATCYPSPDEVLPMPARAGMVIDPCARPDGLRPFVIDPTVPKVGTIRTLPKGPPRRSAPGKFE